MSNEKCNTLVLLCRRLNGKHYYLQHLREAKAQLDSLLTNKTSLCDNAVAQRESGKTGRPSAVFVVVWREKQAFEFISNRSSADGRAVIRRRPRRSAIKVTPAFGDQADHDGRDLK
jgi:hypothetical protein